MPIKKAKTASPRVAREVAESAAQTASQTSAIQTQSSNQIQQVNQGLEALQDKRDAFVDKLSDTIVELTDMNLMVRDAFTLAGEKMGGGSNQLSPFVQLANTIEVGFQVSPPPMLNEAPPQASNLLTAGDYE